LALASDDLDPRCPLRIAGASSTRLLIGVRGAGPLAQLKPDMSRLTTLSAQIGTAGYFVFALNAPGSEPLTEARMFCPALGIGEDPVSGNAHGLLGVYLVQLDCSDTMGTRRPSPAFRAAGFTGPDAWKSNSR